jgi:hypothetical protein
MNEFAVLIVCSNPDCALDRTAEDDPSNVPCPSCGQQGVSTSIGITDLMGVRDATLTKAKRKEPRVDGHRRGTETTSGTDFSRATGHLVGIDRHLDRNENTYTERVVDLDSGEILREVDETKDVHQGRGDARKRS